MRHIKLLLISTLLTVGLTAFSQIQAPSDTLVYKSTEQGDLKLHIFYPEDHTPQDQRPVAVFFFGGGWVGGNPAQFYQQSNHFAKLGIVAISAEYRVQNTHGTSPFECVKDGKSAIRWVRENAGELGIDPDKVISAGGSAGGHVAACTGVIKGYEEVGENYSISSAPDIMILFNPVIDTSEKGYGSEKVKGRETEISPCHNVTYGLPPALVFHGTSDGTVPYENVQRFEKLMKAKGNECLLIPAFGAGHGFFNGSWFRKGNSDKYFSYTMYQSEVFLWKNGFLEEEPIAWELR